MKEKKEVKRILSIIGQFPGRTGSGIFINRLAEIGKEKGIEEALVAAKMGETFLSDAFLKSYFLEFDTEEIPFPIVGMSDEMPYKSKKWSDMDEEEYAIYTDSFSRLIEKAVKEFKPDMIICHHLWLVTSLVKKLFPEIYTVGICHGTGIRQIRKNPFFKDDIVKGIKKLDKVFSLNKEQTELIVKYFGVKKEKIEVLGGGMDPKVFYPDFRKNKKPTIVYAGKISVEKGLLEALDAVNMLEEDVTFKVFGSGSGENYERILKKIEESEKDIRYMGELSQKELGEEFRASDIFLMPSYYEGLSLVSLEALASGLFLVANEDLFGLRDFLGEKINESGMVEYVKRDENYSLNLKNAIELQLEKVSFREKIFRNIEKEVEKFSWENIFQKILV